MMELLPGMTAYTIAIVGLGLVVAGVIKGATGLGYSSCALPFLVYAVGLKTAIALVLLPAMATNIAVALGNGHLNETCRTFARLYMAMLPGIALGLWLLAQVDSDIAVRVLGVSIMAYVMFTLTRPQMILPPRLSQALQIPVGLTNGLLTGLTGSQVMPMVPYFLAHDLAPARIIQAINLGVLMASAALAAGLATSGVADGRVLGASVIAIGPALIGVEMGRRLQTHIPAALLKKAILCILAIAGLGLMLR